MGGRSRSKRRIPALFTALGNIIGKHWRGIAAGAGGIGGIVAILSQAFGIQLDSYGTVLVQYLTSDGATTVLLLIVLISQILLYQRVEWIMYIVEQNHEADKPAVEPDTDAETEEARTDGGSSDLPPRDSKGRFTTSASGSSNVFLLLLAALTGYLFGVETNIIDPIAAALIAVALIALFQSKNG